MWRTINTFFRFSVTLFLTILLLLNGFPSQALVDSLSRFARDRNIVDTLYLSLQDNNVKDKGLEELLRPKVESAKAATFSIQTGYYVGNNTDDREITGLGFSPDLVLLKDNTTSGSEGMIFKTSAMASELTLVMAETDANLTTNHIQSLDSDGFTVGNDTDVNAINVMYYYTAFSGSDCTSSGTFCVGSYSGNGTSQTITSVGFQPDLVVVKRGTNSSVGGIWKSSAMSSTTSAYFSATNSLSSGGIESLTSTGFSVGSNADVNNGTSTYYYFAFKEVSNFLAVGSYSGSGSDGNIIDSSDDAGLTFEPNLVWVKNHSTTPTAVVAVASFREQYGDRSVLFTDAASAANHIQELRSAGGFEVGTSGQTNTSSLTYYFVAFGGASARSPGTGNFYMMNGKYTGTGSGFSVTGLGFSPDLVIIKHNDQATDRYAVFRTSLMYGDRTAYIANSSTVLTGGITAIGVDGFTIGTDASVNTADDTYYWTAFGNAMKPDVSGGSANFLVGQYTGTIRDNTKIRALPISPDMVTVKRVGASQAVWKTSNMFADENNTLFFHATPATSNHIKALNSDGFTVGTTNNVNASGGIYDYFAFVAGDRFTVDYYASTTGAQDITTAGFQPDYLWIKKLTGGTARGAVLRTSAQTGTAAQPFLNSPTVTSESITNLLANGFSIGTAVEINESSSYVYPYAAWDAKQYTQQTYRFFANDNSTGVGDPLAATGEAGTLSSSGEAFRLRLLMRIDKGNLFTGGQNFKLQFAEKSGTCDTSFADESYSDVTDSTVIAFNDNAPDDGEALAADGDDPTDSGRAVVNQSYEEVNPFTNTEGAINNEGQDGKWDFALIDNSADPETDYCLRVVKANGDPLDAYAVIPQITTAAASGNTAPNNPSSLAQKKVTGGATLSVGDWTDETQVQFTASASDTDNPDTLYLCVEKKAVGVAFTNTEDSCGTGVAYSGSPVTVAVNITSQSDDTQYHWQARVKDTAGDYSGWISFGGNTDPNDADYGIDTSAPTGGTVNDGLGSDVAYNDGSLSQLTANWSGIDTDVSGLALYEYAIGTTQGGTNTKDWTGNGTGTDVTVNSLSLRTGQTYYFSVRTTDNAGNVSNPIYSNGQAVAPTLTFTYASGASITFSDLNSGNGYTDDSQTTVLRTSTNAYGGYVIKARALDTLRAVSRPSFFISHFGSSNSNPSVWSGTGFGYTTNDDNLSGGTANRFTSGGPKYAGWATEAPGDPVADNTAPVVGAPLVNDDFIITYRVTAGATTAAGRYTTAVIYTVVPQY